MSIHRPELEQALERRLRAWREVESLRRPTREIDLRVVSFSRQVGSGGRLIAARVAQVLELPFFDWDALRRIAPARSGATTEEPSADSLEVEGGSLRHVDQPPPDYREQLTTAMEAIADGDGGLVLGRGANFILPRERCLRVRIVAPPEIRADYLARILELEPEAADAAVRDGDADRRAFVRHYFDADIDEDTHYDLVLNMDLYSLDAAVVMVLQAWGAARQIWGG